MALGFNHNFKDKNIITRKITIDSFDRDKSYNSSKKNYSDPNDYKIKLEKYDDINDKIIGISLISALIPNSEYTINENNKYLDIIIGNDLHCIELTPGVYDFDDDSDSSFSDEFANKLNETGVETPFTVTIDNKTSKMEINHINDNFTILFETGINNENTFYDIIGFQKKDYESTDNKLTSDFHIILHPTKYVDIVIDELPNISTMYNFKDKNDLILDRIYFDNNYGTYKSHYVYDYDRIYNFFNGIELKYLSIKLFNDKGHILDSNGLDNVITLELIMLKDDSPNNQYINPAHFNKYLKEMINDKKISEKRNKEFLSYINKNNQDFNDKLIKTLNNTNSNEIIKLFSNLKNDINNLDNNLYNKLNNSKNKDLNENNETTFNLNTIIFVIIIIFLLLKILTK